MSQSEFTQLNIITYFLYEMLSCCFVDGFICCETAGGI
uniref:Uncharacterized protein n=1 Tax=Schistosoma curassoni TaxID=6186 RepID=A0A183KCJ6_9TREM